MLYVPRNFAHGFLSLEPNTATYYLVGEYYSPDCERGVRYDDPKLGINWPMEVTTVSEKDKSWPLL
jgi:dTDP-4-dehydrorhamnose 3,5-epimerase